MQRAARMMKWALVACVVVLAGATVGQAEEPQQRDDTAALVELIRSFWRALGASDSEGIIRCLTFPVMAIEVSDAAGVDGEPYLYTTPEQLRREIADGVDDDFASLRVGEFRVVYLQGRTAVVIYRATGPLYEGQETIELFIVAERDVQGAWRIRVASLPM